MNSDEMNPESTPSRGVNAVRLTALVLLLSAMALAADLAWMAPGRIPVQGNTAVSQVQAKARAQTSDERADRHYEKTAAGPTTENLAN
jgi:hypothetical protein